MIILEVPHIQQKRFKLEGYDPLYDKCVKDLKRIYSFYDMVNGLTREEASEVLTHMAFYSGWPTVFSTLPVFKEVFTGRTK